MGYLPREVAAVSALIAMFAGLGFAAGPMIVGAVAEVSGSLTGRTCGDGGVFGRLEWSRG